MDLGVKGLEDKGELQIRGRDFTKKTENYGEFISNARKTCLDPYTAPLKALRKVFLGFLTWKLFRKGLEQFIDNDQIVSAIMWFLGSSFLGYNFSANRPVNAHLKYVFPFYPFFGSMFSLVANQKNLHGFFLEAVKKSGFMSIEVSAPGSHIMVIMDERDRQYVLRNGYTNYLKNFRGNPSSTGTALAELFGRGIFAVDQAEWQDHRKIASHLFSSNALKFKMEKVFNEHGDKLTKIFGDLAAKKQAFDVQKLFQALIFDAFCEIAFGVSPKSTEEYVENNRELPFLSSFDFIQNTLCERFMQVPIVWQVLRVLRIGQEGKLIEHCNIVDSYIRQIVADRKRTIDTDNHEGDMLSLYIEHAKKHTEDEYMLGDDYLLDMVKNYMVAGRDTTACLLTNLLKYIPTNEQAEKNLVREIQLNSSPDGFLSYDVARTQMPFASSCVNEALRLLPPVCEDSRVCQSDETLPSGLKVKRGILLLIDNLAVGRNPRLWKNPDSFLPERWLENKDHAGIIKRPDEYMFPVFWGGPRICLGVNMARFEAITILSKVFANFKVIPIPNQDESLFTSIVGFYAAGMFITVQPRS